MTHDQQEALAVFIFMACYGFAVYVFLAIASEVPKREPPPGRPEHYQVWSDTAVV